MTDENEFTADGEDPGYAIKWKFNSSKPAEASDGAVRIEEEEANLLHVRLLHVGCEVVKP